MSVIYRCDRPGCETTSHFPLKTERVCYRMAPVGNFTTLEVMLCEACMSELRGVRQRAENEFWMKMETRTR